MSSSISEKEKHVGNINEQNETIIELQLGDIINITNPLNEKIDNQTFIIDYIDSSKAYLINTDTLERIKLKISEDGIIGDGNISRIAILSRSDTPSYARQNDLLPNKWINIYFGGEFPIILTGEITNLEEDMIEVKTMDGDTIYINFDYKGIPEDLPIQNIEIREKPQEPVKQEVIEEENEVIPEEGNEEEKIPDLQKDLKFIETEKIQIGIPIKNVKDQLREFVLKADQIKFGDEELGPIVQYIDVSSKSQRYSLEAQVSDLLDELLSTIPNSQRTPNVLNNIHIMIERFKQLRHNFSSFDKYGTVDGILVKEAFYKPLSNYFNEFKQNLYWILPVVKNIKKVYNVNEIDEEITDIVNLEIDDSIDKIKQLVENYKSNTLPSEQNKYSALYNELNPYFTPFDLISDESISSVLIEKNVNNDINVIINNLEDMYSSVFYNNMIRTKRFVIQKYNLGLTKLDTLDSNNSRTITTRIPMTKSDTMSLTSFITLPEPTIRFSKINLPGTNILDRANLNLFFLDYWKLLKKKTNVNEIFIDNLNNEIDFNESNFVNSIKNYVLNLSDDDTKGLSKQEIYNKFINIIIPKTRILFDLIKKYITGKLSIVDVVSYLEPFLVYTDDLTYMQYVEIIKFIDEKISEYNKTFVERSRLFTSFNRIKSNPPIFPIAFSILSIVNPKLREEVFSAYDINSNVSTISDTNSEILHKLISKDCSKLYTTALSLENIPLMFPNDISSIFQDEKNKLDNKIKTEEESDKCKTKTIAKYYTSLEALNADNDKTIYFDKKFDKTNYGILDSDYEKEIIKLNPEDLKLYITNDLVKKNFSEKDADYMANTLLDGYKKVLDGQYAILYKGYRENSNEETDYYVRKENKWILDKDTSNILNTDESDILCNIQQNCISVPSKIDDKCETIKEDELRIQTNFLKTVINEFDMKYKISKADFEKHINAKFEYFMDTIGKLSMIYMHNLLQYNNQKYKLGVNYEDELSIKPISPSLKLINLILAEKYFVKKQHNIVRFVNTYTRPPTPELIANNIENIHWLYCLKTGAPLLPSFKFDLASAYVMNPTNYKNYLELVISKIGKLSDDGNMWTDENSGWTICPIDLDVEEGYEEGFKISTRAIIEEDAGNKIMMSNMQTVNFSTPESKMINNIVNAISVAMGINIEIQKEFIINCVLIAMKETLEGESEYKDKIKEMAEKGKKIMSYKDFYNTAILYYTIAMFLIAVQTAIPSVKTRKTHPGCVRSFAGYPFEGAGDLSSLIYLACVVYDIRDSGEPWNVLKNKKKDFIISKVKSSIDDVLLSLPEVRRKFEEKVDYLLTNPMSDIPQEHDIANWTEFLPPLVPFKILNLVNISNEFKTALINDLRSGSNKQCEKILVIDSKVIQFSLAIQEKIQDIVKKNSLVLHNSNNEPYLENSCCQTNEGETTIGYFEKHSPQIIEYNEIVKNLTNILSDIVSYSKGGLFYSDINTKNKYPPLSNIFDERIIYLSFIVFCKFKSLVPIPSDLLPLCTDKPDTMLINPNDSIDRIIQKLKDDGRNYSSEQFLRLIQLVARNNILHVDVNNQNVSSITKLLNLLESIDYENDEVVEQKLRALIINSLDTFDIASNTITPEVKELNNFLIKSIQSMKVDLIEFVEKNSGANIRKNAINKFKNVILNVSTWETDSSTRNENIKISQEKMYNIVNFYRTFIENFVSVFPNIILNKVDYNDTLIPNYLGFSFSHAKKLKKSISEYYEKLKSFYGLPSMTNVLTTIQTSANNLLKLSKDTPCFSTIKNGDSELKPVFDERTSRYLYEYYLLRVLINYIDLSDESSMLVTEVKRETEITELFTVDYLEENDTRIDLTMNSMDETQTRVLSGNMKELRQQISQLLIAFTEIMNKQKDIINLSYEDIQDRVFKLREKEKDMVTDRLKNLTDEARDADTILKINKLAQYSKGLQKGLTILDKDFYDEEREFRDEMVKAEKNIRKNNRDANDENMDILLDEYMEQSNVEKEIDDEAYDMDYINEDFFDGNTDGAGAPEEEYDDYTDYN
jgi:hypothetical protein